MSDLAAGIIGTGVGVAMTVAVDIVRSGLRARRERRMTQGLELAKTLQEIIEDLRELQGAVFAGVEPRHAFRKDRPT